MFNIPMLKWVERFGYNYCFVEEEMFCYIIPSYLFSSIGWTCFNPYTYIQAKLAHITSYNICNGIWMKTVGLIAPLIQAWHKLSIGTWFHFITLQKHLTLTKPVANVNASALLCLYAMCSICIWRYAEYLIVYNLMSSYICMYLASWWMYTYVIQKMFSTFVGLYIHHLQYIIPYRYKYLV